MEPKRSCICCLGEAATRRKVGHLYYGRRWRLEAAKNTSKRSLNRCCACRRWKPEAAKSTSKRRPTKSTSKKRLEPARITSKGSPTCRKAGHLYYAGGRKKAAGMEPKRSCICCLGEAAGISLSPKTTS
jgi:hypothetical protein